MSAGQLHYEFHGMQPSDGTENFLNEEFGPLLEWAPKDASLRLRVEVHPDGFDGRLLLQSSGGTFKVEGKADDLTDLVKSLKKRMKGKLHKWKDNGHHFTGHPHHKVV
jgi:hypothetical protein